jgi:chemotaxis protein MotB
MRTPLGIALALLVAGCVSQDTYRKKELEADKFRRDLQEETSRSAALQARIDAAKSQLEQLEADAAALRDKVHAAETNLAAKQQELNAAQGKVAELTALVDELSKSKRKLEQAKAELEKKSSEYEQLAGSLKGEIEAGRVELSELRGRMTVKMKDKILFPSGSATLNKDGKESLRTVARALGGISGKTIRVEGHTDDVPSAPGGPFPSNWELSSARALAVVRFLQEVGVDPTHLAAAGYGEFQPIAPNDTPEGRAQNRRIEIVLAAIEGAVPVPAPATPGKL